MSSSYFFGILSEYFAVLILLLKGYQIIRHRYKSNAGEIDLIAKKGGIIIFIEVKARNNIDNIHEVITEHQKNRITRSASVFVAQNSRLSQFNMRFDVILIAPRTLFFKHITNAWGY